MKSIIFSLNVWPPIFSSQNDRLTAFPSFVSSSPVSVALLLSSTLATSAASRSRCSANLSWPRSMPGSADSCWAAFCWKRRFLGEFWLTFVKKSRCFFEIWKKWNSEAFNLEDRLKWGLFWWLGLWCRQTSLLQLLVYVLNSCRSLLDTAPNCPATSATSSEKSTSGTGNMQVQPNHKMLETN